MLFVMNVYAAIALCFVPLTLLFVLIHIFSHMKIINELLAVLFGLFAVLPISFLQFYIGSFSFFTSNNWITQLLHIILFNGLIEELFKALALAFFPSRKITLGNFFLCALLCGMSLACFESAIYFLQELQQAHAFGAQLIYRQIFMRMFTADIVHMLCAGLGGLFIWSVKHHKIAPLAIICAVLLHGLYDFFALYDTLRIFSIVAILLMAVQCRLSYLTQVERNSEQTAATKKNRTVKRSARGGA